MEFRQLSRPCGTEQTVNVRPGNELPGYFYKSLTGQRQALPNFVDTPAYSVQL